MGSGRVYLSRRLSADGDDSGPSFAAAAAFTSANCRARPIEPRLARHLVWERADPCAWVVGGSC